eukprot:13764646-Alexandrium_andersonii.AAC.1
MESGPIIVVVSTDNAALLRAARRRLRVLSRRASAKSAQLTRRTIQLTWLPGALPSRSFARAPSRAE